MIYNKLQLQLDLFDLLTDVLQSRDPSNSPYVDVVTVQRPSDGETLISDSQYKQEILDFAEKSPAEKLEHTRLQVALAALKELDLALKTSVNVKHQEMPEPRKEGYLENARVDAREYLHRDDDSPLVALLSMPWMAPTMPSIQLASVKRALEHHGVTTECYEFYLDYAAKIGMNLFGLLSNGSGFTAEWLFSRHYYGPERRGELNEYRRHRPRFGLESRYLEEKILDILFPVTESFLEDILNQQNWERFDLIGFSITIAQLAPSMALAMRIKHQNPNSTIVFGGSGCAGEMGKAILRICPYVDIVVHAEGEPVLPVLAKRVSQAETLEGIPGISWRNKTNDDICTGPSSSLYSGMEFSSSLSFDAYFQRVRDLGLQKELVIWLPFESSRGCWYGEKIQCTFCGLHEIMKFRSWGAKQTLGELQELYGKYRIGRFFSVDLIMPREFFREFIPELALNKLDWLLFYEVKANMNRQEIEQLAEAGIKWIQPGIESLDTEILRLMKKGVSTIQNIQLLRWCGEYDIHVTWNIIIGLPYESETSYVNMLRLIPLLFHLPPPSGMGEFQLHRFSPYFRVSPGNVRNCPLEGQHSSYNRHFSMTMNSNSPEVIFDGR